MGAKSFLSSSDSTHIVFVSKAFVKGKKKLSSLKASNKMHKKVIQKKDEEIKILDEENK